MTIRFRFSDAETQQILTRAFGRCGRCKEDSLQTPQDALRSLKRTLNGLFGNSVCDDFVEEYSDYLQSIHELNDEADHSTTLYYVTGAFGADFGNDFVTLLRSLGADCISHRVQGDC